MEKDRIEKEEIRNRNAVLAILYALMQFGWTFYFSLHLKKNGTLAMVTSPYGYLPLFLCNLLVALPMIFVFIGAVVRYRRDFDDKLLYIKTERYTLTLILTVVYSVMLPISVRLDATPRKGAFAWLYYLLFIAFLEEFLFRGLVPTLLESSSFPRFFKSFVPALLYGLYQCMLPLAQYGVSRNTLISCIPDIIWSTVFHYCLIAAKKWSGAMWLPIMIHAIVDISIHFIF